MIGADFEDFVPMGACGVEPDMGLFLHRVSDVEVSGIEVLELPARADVGVGIFEAPNGPEKGGLPPLATEGVDLEKR